MPQKIAVQLEDGQIITYRTNLQSDREIAAEVRRLFPFARSWRKEFSVASEGYQNFSLNQAPPMAIRSPSARKSWVNPLIFLCLVTLGLYFKDVIYTEIQIQILKYQLKRAVVQMLTSQHPVVIPTPTLTAGSKRVDIGVISSDRQKLSGFVKVDGAVQNFGLRPYNSIKVQVVFYDERGNEVTTQYDFVEPNMLDPGQQGTFSAMAENNEGKIRFYQVMILD